MPDLSNLPPILQVVVTMVVLICGGLITWLQFSSKWLAKLPAPVRNAPSPSADTVVVSGAFADGKPMRDLAHAIAQLHAATEVLITCTRQGTEEQARTTAGVARLTDRVSRVADVLDDRLPHARD